MRVQDQNSTVINSTFQGWWTHYMDPWLLLTALMLTGLGLIMVYSSSSALAIKRYLDEAYFVRHQVIAVALGIFIMTWIAIFDYHKLFSWSWPIFFLVFIALIAVLIPGIGYRAGGAVRWLRLGLFSIQPAELAKLAIVIFLARWLSTPQLYNKNLFIKSLFCLGGTIVITIPILVEPDLGTGVMIVILSAILLFVAGNRLSYLATLGLVCLPGLYFLVFKVNYRLDRLVSFLNPWEDPADNGFQIIHSFMALGSGGFMGAGLGGSKQKLFYLPEPHTDFILSVLGEELGFLGIALVLSLFMLIVWRGLRVAFNANDAFGTYLALGATLVIGLQAFVNSAVVMGLLPTKGLTLPFISYGGSSILTNFASLGILLSVARQQGKIL